MSLRIPNSASLCTHCLLRLYHQQARARAITFRLRPRCYSTESLPSLPFADDTQAPDETNSSNEPLRPSREALVRRVGGPKRPGGATQNRPKDTTHQLQIDRLGSPSQIIVLGDKARKRKPRSSQERREKSSDGKGQIYKGLLSDIKDGQANATQAEVTAQLDKLRPEAQQGQYVIYISKDEYGKLFRSLLNGFNTKQLFNYFRQRKPEPEPETKSSRWSVVDRLEWKKRSKVQELIRGQSSKERLLHRFLAQIWKLEVIEDIESGGELQLHMRDNQRWPIALLQTKDGAAKLEQISSDRRTNIELDRESDSISITADKTSAEYAADDIDAFLKTAKQGSFPLDLSVYSKSGKKQWEQDNTRRMRLRDLNHASSLTNTYIWFSKRDEVQIASFHESDIEHAKRILRAMVGLPKPTKSILLGDKSSLRKAAIRIPFLSNTLHYVDRTAKLGRWCLPISRKTAVLGEGQLESRMNFSPNEDPDEDSSRTILRNMLHAYRLAPLTLSSDQDAAKSEGWASEVRQEIMADFGHALHDMTKSNPRVWADKNEGQLPGRSRRVFLNLVPGATETMQVLSAERQPRSYDHLILRLVPEKMKLNSPKRKGSQGPDLEMRWALDGERKLKFEGVRAYLGNDTADYLLPRHAVDIRFTRREVCFSSEVMNEQKWVQELDTIVQESYVAGQILRAPPSVSVSLPKWFTFRRQSPTLTFKQDDFKAKDFVRSVRGGSKTLLKFVPVGFEHRQSTIADIGPYELTYTAIDGGQIQGNSGRLRFSLKPYNGATEEFMDSAFNLAGLFHLPAQGDINNVMRYPVDFRP